MQPDGRARPAQYPRLGETTRSWLDRTPGFGNTTPAETIDVMEVMYPHGYRANIQGPEQFRTNENATYSAELLVNIAPTVDVFLGDDEHAGNHPPGLLGHLQHEAGLRLIGDGLI